jgi:menaquinone-dependent protoporphyrinogen IX oxidase
MDNANERRCKTMSNVLIVYGTRYGAAASTSEEIAETLRQRGFEVRVVNSREEKVKDIARYDLVVVGSGIQMNRWTHEPEDFLRDFQRELNRKMLAVFVCCGSASKPLNEGKPPMVEKARKKYLEEKVSKYNLHPAIMGLFGGVYNYNKVPWYAKKAMNAERPKIEATYKETQPGVYDTRDVKGIQVWAEELAKLLSSRTSAKSTAGTRGREREQAISKAASVTTS